MLDHLCITVSDLDASTKFYQRALAPLGYRVTRREEGAVGFGVASGPHRSLDPDGDFWMTSGTPIPDLIHFAFAAETRSCVDAFYSAAIDAGGRDNGEPGLRPRYHADYYAAFIVDPDGHMIEAVCHSAGS